ncbi:hypothetical protein CEXT_558781 [Caerostris extrusa]|uniref:Ribosomal protein L32 n=1 Tax=Caerostris extrusa TaxID=172846 RepID=A0AAV4RQ78_CAEEX|nr:hypothetical protein CEXT_558781 [Caerostris extrusa]
MVNDLSQNPTTFEKVLIGERCRMIKKKESSYKLRTKKTIKSGSSNRLIFCPANKKRQAHKLSGTRGAAIKGTPKFEMMAS